MISKKYSLRRFLLTALGVPVVISALGTAASVTYLTRGLLMEQMQRSVAGNLQSAREIYRSRLQHLEESAHYLAGREELRQALEKGDLARLRLELQSQRRAQGADVLTLVDASGTVLARGRLSAREGDSLSHLAPVRRALSGGVVSSAEVFSQADLRNEGEDLALQAEIPLLPTPYAEPRPETRMTSGLMLAAAAPVVSHDGRVLGALLAAELQNRSYALVDKIRATVFPEYSGGERLVGTATLFLDDVRVSTNVASAKAERAIGTRVSREVSRKVLRQGESWLDRAYVVDQWYISAYEPLRNLQGETIGILYVGVSEAPFEQLFWRLIRVVSVFHLVGVGLVIVFGVLCYRWLGSHLAHLTQNARRIAEGDLDRQIPQEWEDELGELTDEFNQMTAALKAREEAYAALNRDLDRKVRERSAELETRNAELVAARQDLLQLMEKQRATNEELAASLEKLRATQAELVRSGKLSALGTMAAGVAHEINTPLAVIQGNADILKIKAGAYPELLEEVELITGQTARMQKIVSRLLAFARREEGEVVALDGNEVVRDALQMVAQEARQNRVEVAVNLDDALPPVSGNRDRLLQVFTNLCLNAVQAMPGGGVLRVSSQRGPKPSEVSWRIEDTGPGIRPEARERIWNPFYTTKAQGTGLGLSISHTIIEEHAGRLLVDSEPGRGTCFTVVLPLREA